MNNRHLSSILSKACRQRNFFNLIEVVLAIGILGVGTTSILGLLPVALSADTDTVASNYAVENVDYFLHSFQYYLANPGNNYQNWTSFGQLLPEDKPGSEEPQSWNKLSESESLLIAQAAGDNQFYKVEHATVDGSTADFTAIYRVWATPISYPQLEEGEWKQVPIDKDTALAVHLEVSWPAQIPYERRRQQHYYLEMFKPM
jgi:hypothetical protein